ncbi:MAG: hypothetical protein C0404_11375 [Verrucomicrobia bacterium]|nr:hypothetical protein [Verrucomicrobiota bacterium]
MNNITDITQKKARNISYAFMVLMLAVVAWQGLATPLLSALFSYLALRALLLGKNPRKWTAIALFMILLAAICYGFSMFVADAAKSLPEIVEKLGPSVMSLAREYQVNLPFNDYDSLKAFVIEAATDRLPMVGHIARVVTTQLVFLIIGCIVAISIFLSPVLELGRPLNASPRNLYSLCLDEVSARFSAFYRSFATVMGAQLAISLINTALTMIFVLATGMPHTIIIVGVTFLCGMLPVIGNLVSNAFIIGIGLTVSPTMALAALAFLVTIHKLEYFLNSRIIGARIRNPLWLMLIGLLIGERLMGIPGMILAPVLLYYIKVEASGISLPAAKEVSVTESLTADPTQPPPAA